MVKWFYEKYQTDVRGKKPIKEVKRRVLRIMNEQYNRKVKLTSKKKWVSLEG